MHAIQQFLFADDALALAEAHRKIHLFRNAVDEEREFARAIAARLATAEPGALVLVGCSPAVSQERLVADVLRVVFGVTAESSAAANSVVTFPAPPNISGQSEQLRVMHDRYRLRRHGAEPAGFTLDPGPLVAAQSTETEAVIALLRERGIRLVSITHGEQMVSTAVNCMAPCRLLFHLADLARRSAVPHLVFGHRMALLRAAKVSVTRLSMDVVLQPMYDPDNKAMRQKFAEVLAFCEDQLRGCCDVPLTKHTKTLMAYVAGDPCRMTRWVSYAVREAARHRRRTVTWTDFAATFREVPPEAAADFSAYRDWLTPANLALSA